MPETNLINEDLTHNKLEKYAISTQDLRQYNEIHLVCASLHPEKARNDLFTVGQAYHLKCITRHYREHHVCGESDEYTFATNGITHNLSADDILGTSILSERNTWVKFIPKHKLTEEELFMLNLTDNYTFLGD